MSNISVSVVLYNTDKLELDAVISSCVNSSLSLDVYLIDNSPNDRLSYLKKDGRVHYLASNNNHGFGAGHNLAINKFGLLDKYDYHIVLNPDIVFDAEVAGVLYGYMDSDCDIGIVMPKIINKDSSLQLARRLLPSPLDIFMKRFFPASKISKEYEIADLEPNKPVEMAGVCGCFMFIRTSALKSIGLFDERYFMYFEDFDLCRRMLVRNKIIYYPMVKVVHGSNNEHRRNFKLFLYSIRAAFMYFIKWGFFDDEMKAINKRVRELVWLASKE